MSDSSVRWPSKAVGFRNSTALEGHRTTVIFRAMLRFLLTVSDHRTEAGQMAVFNRRNVDAIPAVLTVKIGLKPISFSLKSDGNHPTGTYISRLGNRFLPPPNMIRKAIILLSLCCAVLCAFVGYLSYNVTQESEKAVGAGVTKTCDELLESPLSETSRISLTDFAPGKHIALVDNDEDNQWDRLCVPFFPRRHQKIGYGYRAVLVCFKDVKTREALDALIENGELDINYWPERQQLDRAIHSQLAQKYTNLDLAHSPVLYYGFDAANPVLGESSMYASAGVGSVSIFVAFLAMISGLFTRTKPTLFDVDTEEQPTTNRAGLPVSEGPSIFDQVTSTRSVLSD